jgi:hypothetical protein
MMDYYYHSELTPLDYFLPILALPDHNFLRSPKECMRIRLGLLRLVVLGIVG